MFDELLDLQILVELEEAVNSIPVVTPRGLRPSWSELERFVEYARVKVHRDGGLDLNRVGQEIPGLQPVADFLQEHPGLVEAFINAEAQVERTRAPSMTDIMDEKHPSYVRDYEALERYYPEYAKWEEEEQERWHKEYPEVPPP